jgi:hypothetical protein
MSLRAQSLLNLKMYKLKKHELKVSIGTKSVCLFIIEILQSREFVLFKGTVSRDSVSAETIDV